MTDDTPVTVEETKPTAREWELARFHVNELIGHGYLMGPEEVELRVESIALYLCLYRLELKTGIPVEVMPA